MALCRRSRHQVRDERPVAARRGTTTGCAGVPPGIRSGGITFPCTGRIPEEGVPAQPRHDVVPDTAGRVRDAPS
jgi:hypothetical protein